MLLKSKILMRLSVILLVTMISSSVSFAETIIYTYDDLNRLTSTDYGNGTSTSYTYDAAGNRLTMTTTPQGNGKIYGNVVDIDNNPIESASIKAKGKEIDVTISTTTDAEGFYEFTNVWTDTYIITTKKNGYSDSKKTIKLQDGKKKKVKIVMKLKE